MTAPLRFPGVPAVYVYHGWRPWEEAPPRFPRILRYIAVSRPCRDRLVFEHAIADFGQSQGNVATGFVLADMADPARTTNAARAYGCKQLIYEPFLGGGILTAFSVPIILAIGSLAFGVISLGITVLLILWGTLRRRRSTPTATPG